VFADMVEIRRWCRLEKETLSMVYLYFIDRIPKVLMTTAAELSPTAIKAALLTEMIEMLA